jgi:hypothetical protein
LARLFESVYVKHYKASKVTKLRNCKQLCNASAAHSSDDSICDTTAPTDKEDKKNNVELLVNVNQVVSLRIEDQHAAWICDRIFGLSARTHHV